MTPEELLTMTPEERAKPAPVLMGSEGTGCVGCTNCEHCAICTNCMGCTNCTNCWYCKNCTNCEHCKKCMGCTKCTDCWSCTKCIGIVGGNGLRYVAWGVQLTAEQWGQL